MNRKKTFLLATFVILIVIVGLCMIRYNFSVQATQANIRKRDLPERGLFILNSADISFEDNVIDWLPNKRSEYQSFAKNLKPFSFFIENSTNHDVIAYRLKWELTDADGKVTSYSRNYFEPNSLIGIESTDAADYAHSKRRIIRKNSARFFTIISSPFEEDDLSGNDISAINLRDQEVSAFLEAIQNGNLVNPISKLSEQLNQATDVTMVIDGALFDDGTYAGPNSEDFFLQIKAYITAKRDLLEMMNSASINKENISNIFSEVGRTANQPIKPPIPTSVFDDFYNYYKKIHAEEVIGMRQVINNDSKTLRICLNPLHKNWNKLVDLDRPQSNK